MPLLNKRPFEREPVPPNLQPSDRVYFLEASNEVFTDYDSYFDRVILLSSTLWSCSITGKSGLTYYEARDSEKAAQDRLESFPDDLIRPLLYLAHKYTHRGRLCELVDDIHGFMNGRYFIGEKLRTKDGSSKDKSMMARILAVHALDSITSPSSANSSPTKSGRAAAIASARKQSSAKLSKIARKGDAVLLPPEQYRYDVQMFSPNDEGAGDGKRRERVVGTWLNRPKAVVSRTKVQLLLRNSTKIRDGHYVVLDELVEAHNLGGMSWEDIFSGPEPVFTHTTYYGRSKSKKAEEEEEEAAEKNELNAEAAKPVHSTPSKPGKPRKSAAQAQATPSTPVKSPSKKSAKKRAAIVKQQEELGELFAVADRLGVAEIERWRQTERLLNGTDLAELRNLIKQKRLEERELNKERKQRDKELIAAWKRPRDDLECDDLAPLPKFTALPLPDWLDPEQLGDMLYVHHFFTAFGSLLNVDQVRERGRITFRDVLIAVRCPDANNSSLYDLVMVLLRAKTDLADEEDGDEANLNNSEEIPLQLKQLDFEHPRWGAKVVEATLMHEKLRLIHGNQGVRHLSLDWMTMSEVIRLLLKTAGYYQGAATHRLRLFGRGNLHNYEEPIFIFAHQTHQDIYEKLETMSLFELTDGERLEILKLLIEQILTYYKVRTYQEERMVQMAAKNREIRTLRNFDTQQEKEAKDARLAREFEQEKVAEIGEEAAREKVSPREEPSKATQRLLSLLKCRVEGRRFKEDELEAILLEPVAWNEMHLEEVLNARECQRECIANVMDVHRNEYFLMAATTGSLHLGRDRCYRSYFWLDSVPALLVENPTSADNIGPCMENATPIDKCTIPTRSTSQKVVTNGGGSGDEEEEQPHANGNDDDDDNGGVLMAESVESLDADGRLALRQRLYACTGDESTCHIHNLELRKSLGEPRWSVVLGEQTLEQLLAACNPRGYREADLVESINTVKPKLVQAVNEDKAMARIRQFFCIDGPDPADVPTIKNMIQETRELIADLEEKLYQGALGRLPYDRQKWRTALLETGDITEFVESDVVLDQTHGTKSGIEPEDEMTIERSQFADLHPISKLALALHELAINIDIKWLRRPFVQQQTRGDETVVVHTRYFLYWKRSLFGVRSPSALVLHLSTLESHLDWGSSKLFAKCRGCRKKASPDNELVMCTRCSSCFHLKCARPKARDASVTDWNCANCLTAIKRSEARKRTAEKSSERAATEETDDGRAKMEDVYDDESMQSVPDSVFTADLSAQPTAPSHPSRKSQLIDGDESQTSSLFEQTNSIDENTTPNEVETPNSTSRSAARTSRVNGTKRSYPAPTTNGTENDGEEGSDPTRQRTSSGRIVRVRQAGYISSNGAEKTSSATRRSNRNAGRERVDYEEEDSVSVDSSAASSSADTPTAAAAAAAKRSRLVPDADESVRKSGKDLRRERFALIEQVVRNARNNDDYEIFHEPVNKKELPDYYMVVKNPCDLRTITQRIKNHDYSDPRDVRNDIRAIAANCRQYNSDNPELCQLADEFETDLLTRLESILTD